MITGADIVGKAMTQKGKDYRFAAEVDLDDSDPECFDCSELVEWTCYQCGVKPQMPDGSANQMRHCREHGGIISMEDAINTPGALLFRISTELGNHVAIVKDKDYTIEARGKDYGVGVFPINGRCWTHAARVPGVVYS